MELDAYGRRRRRHGLYEQLTEQLSLDGFHSQQSRVGYSRCRKFRPGQALGMSRSFADRRKVQTESRPWARGGSERHGTNRCLGSPRWSHREVSLG